MCICVYVRAIQTECKRANHPIVICNRLVVDTSHSAILLYLLLFDEEEKNIHFFHFDRKIQMFMLCL